jgi:hypothetical protein
MNEKNETDFANLLERLERASIDSLKVPELDIDWAVPFDKKSRPILPRELLSLDTGLCPELAEPTREAELAMHETASILSSFIRFEGFLNERLAHLIKAADPMEKEIPYLFHVIEEEARHSRMFRKTIDMIGMGAYPLNGPLGIVEKAVFLVLGRSKLLLFLAMYAVEEITDGIAAAILRAPEGHPTLAQVCALHRTEEARHMELAKTKIRSLYASASPLTRLSVCVLSLPLAIGIFEVMVSPSVYYRAGLTRPGRGQWRLWWRARQSDSRRRLRSDCARRYYRFLDEAGLVKGWLRPFWNFAGYTHEDLGT